jgi:hypothetical protein
MSDIDWIRLFRYQSGGKVKIDPYTKRINMHLYKKTNNQEKEVENDTVNVNLVTPIADHISRTVEEVNIEKEQKNQIDEYIKKKKTSIKIGKKKRKLISKTAFKENGRNKKSLKHNKLNQRLSKIPKRP